MIVKRAAAMVVPVKMLKTAASILLIVMSLHHRVNSNGKCLNVETSEGIRTLQNGQAVCAPLLQGENEGDKGKRFIICSNGIVYVQFCSGTLRYNTVQNTCTWPQLATCRLENEVQQATSPVVAETTLKEKVTTAAEIPRTETSDAIKVTTPVAGITTVARPTEKPVNRPCTSDSCKLPNCFCYGSRPNLPLKDTPMFIMLTFDDAVTVTLYNSFFKNLLVDNSFNILNPNGCPIRSAFYVNHDYTDYDLVKSLAYHGQEIASHTVNHSLPQGDLSTHYPEAVAEIVGMREKVLQGTGDKTICDSIVGFRSPYLRVAHDVQFDALRDTGFLYDTSITNIETSSGRDPLWPFTLDYIMPRCTNVPCPTKPYPNLWEVPLNGWVGSTGYPCSMIDTCSVGTNVFTASQQEWYEFYKSNFDRYFYPVKVPMQLFTHGSMFLRSEASFPALVSWFQDLQITYKDIWIVTPKMVIEWMKKPLTNAEMIASRWGCQRK